MAKIIAKDHLTYFWNTYIKPKLEGKADKSGTVSNVAYDSTNKKITKTINGTTSDVVTAATLKSAMALDKVTNESKATMFTNAELTGTPTAPTAAAGTESKQIATTEFVAAAVAAGFAANDAMIFKGTIGTGGTVTELPASHNRGWTYRVITAGTYAGVTCEVGDLIICITKGTTANNAHWTVAQTNIDGAVTGPTSSVDGNIPIFNGVSGKIIKDSGVKPYTHPTVSAGAQNTSYNIGFGDSINLLNDIQQDSTGHVVRKVFVSLTMPSNTATKAMSGLMSATDKAKLDGFEFATEADIDAIFE